MMMVETDLRLHNSSMKNLGITPPSVQLHLHLLGNTVVLECCEPNANHISNAFF